MYWYICFTEQQCTVHVKNWTNKFLKYTLGQEIILRTKIQSCTLLHQATNLQWSFQMGPKWVMNNTQWQMKVAVDKMYDVGGWENTQRWVTYDGSKVWKINYIQGCRLQIVPFPLDRFITGIAGWDGWGSNGCQMSTVMFCVSRYWRVQLQAIAWVGGWTMTMDSH